MSATANPSNGTNGHFNPRTHTVEGFDLDVFDKVCNLVANVSISRQEWIRRRLSPDPRRDVYDECGYMKNPTAEEYRDQFDRNPIAGRVVDFMPMECWALPCYVYEDDDPENATEFEMAWDEVGSALRGEFSWYKKEKGNPIWEYLKRADIYSGIGSYGVILLGFNDVKAGDEDGLRKPVKRRKYVAPVRPKTEEEEEEEEEDSEKSASGPNKSDMDEEYDTEVGNAFCPTGPGGGIDPTCSPGKSGKIASLIRDAKEAGWTVEELGDGNTRITKQVKVNKTKTRTEGLVVYSDGTAQDVSVDSRAAKGLRSVKDMRSVLRLTTNLWNLEYSEDKEQQTKTDGDPLYYARKKGPKLNFIRVFPETLAEISAYDNDVTSPRYGLPLEYRITFNDPRDIGEATGIGFNTVTKTVHWTRIIHIAEELASNEVHGTPRQKSVLNNIQNIEKIYSADAEGFWKACFTILSAETHPTLGGDEININKSEMRDMFEAMMNGLQRYGVFQGMTLKSIAPSVSDPTPHINAQVEMICIRKGWPVRIFKGSERGELASSQDEKAHKGRVVERCNNYLTPRIMIPLIDRLIWAGVLPEPSEYCVEWEDTTQQTAMEKAEVFGAMMDGFSKAIGGGVDAMIPPRAILTEFAGIEEEKADQMLEEAVEHQEEKMDKEIADTQKKVDEGIMPDPSKPPPVAPGQPPGKGGAVPPAKGGPAAKPGGFPPKAPVKNADTTDNAFCPTGPGGGVDPTCGSGEGGSAGGDGTGGTAGDGGAGANPIKGKVKVDIDTKDEKLKKVMDSTFGKDVDLDDVAAAANAVPGGKVTISLSKGGGGVRVKTWSEGEEGYTSSSRTFYRDRDGKLVINNDLFVNTDKSVSGAEVLHSQVKAAQKLGADRIETNAARADDGNPPLVGYKVWPKLGYNGAIPDDVFSKLPPEVQSSMGARKGKVFGMIGGAKGGRDIATLYSVPGGREAWEKHGDSIDMTFDVKAGSGNVKRLEAYLAARKAKPKGDKK